MRTLCKRVYDVFCCFFGVACVGQTACHVSGTSHFHRFYLWFRCVYSLACFGLWKCVSRGPRGKQATFRRKERSTLCYCIGADSICSRYQTFVCLCFLKTACFAGVFAGPVFETGVYVTCLWLKRPTCLFGDTDKGFGKHLEQVSSDVHLQRFDSDMSCSGLIQGVKSFVAMQSRIMTPPHPPRRTLPAMLLPGQVRRPAGTLLQGFLRL